MLIMLWNDMMTELDLLSMKYDCLNWLCSWIVIEWSWIQTLENPN